MRRISRTALVLLALAAGCRGLREGAGTERPAGEPLFGEYRSAPARATPAPSRDGERPRPDGFGFGRPEGVPASANPLLRGSEMTNAAMAASLQQRQGHESDLRLEWPSETRRPPPPDPDPPRPPKVTPGNVLLRAPSEAVPAAPAAAGRDSDAYTEEPSEPAGEREMIDELKRLGALEVRLEPSEGGYHFSCVVPGKRNELIQRRYAARDPDKLKAIAAVLAQVRRERAS